MNTYNIGDQARCSIVFTVAAVVTDPTTVTFKIALPDGTALAYIYGTDAELVKDSTGHYHVDFIPTLNGLHHYRFEGTGACQTAEEASFLVTTLSGNPLSVLIDETSAVLEDTGNAVFSDATITQHLGNAVIEASRYAPFEAREAVTLAPSSTDVDVSGICGLLRVVKAEYPPGKTPKAFRNVSRFGDIATIETDLKPAGGDIAYLFCEETHSLASGGSTLTPELERIVVELAAGNAALNWLGAGRTQILNAVSILDLVNSSVDAMTADIARAITDLASVRTNLAFMLAGVSNALVQVDARVDQAVTDIGNARTAFNATESAVATAVAAIAARITQAIDDLTSGRSLINTITVGDSPQSQYASYAVGELNAAAARINEVRAYMQQGSNLANQLYNAANHELNVSQSYSAEGKAIESEYALAVANYGADAARELGVAGGHLSQAQGYVAELNARLSVANIISAYQRWGQDKVAQAKRELRAMAKPKMREAWGRG